jgi:hypothetical protein
VQKPDAKVFGEWLKWASDGRRLANCRLWNKLACTSQAGDPDMNWGAFQVIWRPEPRIAMGRLVAVRLLHQSEGRSKRVQSLLRSLVLAAERITQPPLTQISSAHFNPLIAIGMLATMSNSSRLNEPDELARRRNITIRHRATGKRQWLGEQLISSAHEGIHGTGRL